MTLKEFLDKTDFEVINTGGETEIELTKVFCCDLLSVAMSKNPAGSVWVTVMGNVNTVAVAVLTEGGCIVFAEGASPDSIAVEKAKSQGVALLKTHLPIFDAAIKAHELLSGNKHEN
jgi:hypothetical protein